MSKLEYVELAVAVERLDASERTIRRRISEGDLQGAKRGGKWWVQVPAEIDRPLFSMGQPPGEQTSQQAPTVPSVPPAPPAGNLTPIAESASPRAEAEAPRAGASGCATTERPPPPSAPRPGSSEQTHYRGGKQRERKWSPGRGDYTAASGDGIDQAFRVGRLGAWPKVRELRAVLKNPEDKADGDLAAAMLLEGFLAYGPHKVDCYRQCRTVLCRLVTRLDADEADEDHFMAASDALGAVHALVVTMSRDKDNKKYGKGRDYQQGGSNQGDGGDRGSH